MYGNGEILATSGEKMTKTLIIRKNNLTAKEALFFKLFIPGPGEKGFYRSTGSFNAFFNNGKGRNWYRRNGIEVLYTYRHLSEFEMEEEISKKYGGKPAVFANISFYSIWAFYTYIGYDYKSKRYV